MALACGLGAPRPASAQTEEELAAARALFREAVKDEDRGRFDVALEKFQRVQRTRDTAAVRFHLGACEEGLGRLAQALASYQGAVAAATTEKGQEEVSSAARARIDALWKRVPQLTVHVTGAAPQSVDLRIDDRAIEPARWAKPIPVDPGAHIITATAPNATPFRTQVSLTEAGHVSITIPLDRPGAATTAAGAPTAGTAGQSGDNGSGSGESSAGATGADSKDSSSTTRTVTAWALVGTGGAAAIAGAVCLIVRADNIATLNRTCPGGVCPSDSRESVESLRDQAVTLGPLGAGLIIGGVVAAGVGAALLWTAPSPSAAASKVGSGATAQPGSLAVQLAPWFSHTDAGLSAVGRF